MKAKVLRSENRFDLSLDKSLNIQNYGDGNDYPQKVIEVVNASGTAVSCVDVYSKFIFGNGFPDDEFFKKKINIKGHTNDYLLDQISKDLAMFGGFAIHINYNANYKSTQFQHIPFENVRFEKLDDNGNFNRVAIHPDWGRRYTNLRRFKKEDIEFIDFYNPSPEIIQAQVDASGGWNQYKGQVYYYSNKGDKTYPLPIFDSRLTDMNTEEGISNISNRNARNGYLIGGAIVDVVNDDQSIEQEAETEKAIKAYQGDMELGKLMYIQVSSKEEIPQILDFSSKNYDKEFTVTRESVIDNIGRVFNQPPILRAENVGAGFGSDLMINAYNYYNTVTNRERITIERVFNELYKNWLEPVTDMITISPLVFDVDITLAERLGYNNYDRLMSIINDSLLLPEKKIIRIKTLFGLTDDEINSLL